jgi:hypothetical protein
LFNENVNGDNAVNAKTLDAKPEQNDAANTDVLKETTAVDTTAAETKQENSKAEAAPQKKSSKKKTSKANTDGRQHVSYRLPNETIALIDEGSKKFVLNQTELIVFAINCLVEELDRAEIQRLLDEKKKTKKYFG